MADEESESNLVPEWFLKIFLIVALAGILILIVINAKKVLLP